MENEKNLNENPAFQELPDERLDAVAGGGGLDGDINYEDNDPTPVGSDSQGNTTHWQHANGDVYHYVCPKCGRLLHQGTLALLYCDPCDEWFSSSVFGMFGSAVEDKGWYGK